MEAAFRTKRCRQTVLRAFSVRGILVRPPAVHHLVNLLLEANDDANISVNVGRLMDVLEPKQIGGATVADIPEIDVALDALNAANEPIRSMDHFEVISAFDVPKHRFDRVERRWKRVPTSVLHGDAENIVHLWRDRYELLWQRCMRNRVFIPPAIMTGSRSKEYLKITPIQQLLSSQGNVCVLGMITEMKEGIISLEDPSGLVDIDLTQASMTSGLFTRGCIVLCEGEYDTETKLYHVSAMGLPPPESRRTTVEAFGHVDFFGGGVVAETQRLRLEEAEVNDASTMFVFISDLFLDRPDVLLHFSRVLRGYAPDPPDVFVLCGNFTSRPYGQGRKDVDVLRSFFAELAGIIGDIPEVAMQSRFVLVPGPSDVGGGGVLPRPPLPSSFVEPLLDTDRIQHVILSTNPCRIRYCLQEIMVYRENSVGLMRHQCVLRPDEQDTPEMHLHLVKTLLDESHLCPLPLEARPVYWGADQALWLYPMPDLVVLADTCGWYETQYEECQVMNPGGFPSGWSFLTWSPAERRAEFCKVDESMIPKPSPPKRPQRKKKHSKKKKKVPPPPKPQTPKRKKGALDKWLAAAPMKVDEEVDPFWEEDDEVEVEIQEKTGRRVLDDEDSEEEEEEEPPLLLPPPRKHDESDGESDDDNVLSGVATADDWNKEVEDSEDGASSEEEDLEGL